MKVLALIQARMGSTRLKGKVLKKIMGKSMIEILLSRMNKADLIDKIVVATSVLTENQELVEQVEKLGYEVFRGSEEDVLDRFYHAANYYEADYIIRITADCPLVDPELINSVIRYTIDNQVDYGTNTLLEEFPDGQDIEIFTFDSLCRAWQNAVLPSEREHVTPYIRKNSDFFGKTKFKAINFRPSKNYGHVRMTVDETNDFEAIDRLVNIFGSDKPWNVYADYIINNISEFNNQDIKRNEGYLKSLKNDKNG